MFNQSLSLALDELAERVDIQNCFLPDHNVIFYRSLVGFKQRSYDDLLKLSKGHDISKRAEQQISIAQRNQQFLERYSKNYQSSTCSELASVEQCLVKCFQAVSSRDEFFLVIRKLVAIRQNVLVKLYIK